MGGLSKNHIVVIQHLIQSDSSCAFVTPRETSCSSGVAGTLFGQCLLLSGGCGDIQLKIVLVHGIKGN